MRYFKYLLLLFLFSCVSQDEYDKINRELSSVSSELEEEKKKNQDLENKIEDILYNKPQLIKEVKELYKLKDYKAALSKITELNDRHPNSIETSEANIIKDKINDHINWDSVKNLNSLNDVESYLSAYPEGLHLKEATILHEKLLKEKEEEEYQLALSSSGSYNLQMFINNYPNRADIQKLKELLITREVDEILGDSKTGSLPSFDRNYNSLYNSSSDFSQVTIKNSTGYLLTLRYSGESIKKISIPAGRSSTVTLFSGNYKISASANGLHYGGREYLNGDYTSEYYIKTSRY